MSFTSGSAKIFFEGVNNKKLILAFIKPTEFFGSQGIYANDVHYYSVEALETSTACSINSDIKLDRRDTLNNILWPSQIQY